MNIHKNTEKPIFTLNLKDAHQKISKGDSHDSKSSKETMRYEPTNILIKNYLAASGKTNHIYYCFL